ncbi:MAG: right-handed parallel beta-helix repeat-containing protein [Nitrospira sp.]|nr:right-handed parallel beta-helix repeat-containing protein [Nitrospira sp.]
MATTGNDANPGTLNQPFKSFNKGVSLLQPGDTLYIRGGLYTEQIDLQRPNKSGTAGKNIAIAGYPGETVTLQYADLSESSYGPIKARGNRGYFVFENLVLDGKYGALKSGWSIRDGNHHFILRNIEIKNFLVSGLYISANDIQVINCTIHDQFSETGLPGHRYYGIYFHDGTNGLIEGNDIYNNSGGGIQAYPGPISNLVIRNNKIHDNNTTIHSPIGGIIVSGSGYAVSNVSVYNNLFYNNGSSPLSGSSPGLRIDGANTTGTKVWNNTVYRNKGYGISINQARKTVVQNNIVFENAKGEIVDFGTETMLSHNLTTDPRFLRSEGADFRLQNRSPAIDAGAHLSQISIDFRNIPRPIGRSHDIGAYEADGSDFISVKAPQNLKIQ